MHSITSFAITDAERETLATPCNVLISGDVGVGKTTLARTLATLWGKRHQFITVAGLHHLRTDAPEWRGAHDVPVLILDDLGAEGPTENIGWRVQELLTQREFGNRFTIITTNLNRDAVISRYGAAVASRVNALTPIIIGGEDRRATHATAQPVETMRPWCWAWPHDCTPQYGPLPWRDDKDLLYYCKLKPAQRWALYRDGVAGMGTTENTAVPERLQERQDLATEDFRDGAVVMAVKLLVARARDRNAGLPMRKRLESPREQREREAYEERMNAREHQEA